MIGWTGQVAGMGRRQTVLHPQERGSSEDTDTDWSIIVTGLWQDDLARRTLLVGVLRTQQLHTMVRISCAGEDNTAAARFAVAATGSTVCQWRATCRTVSVGHCAVRQAAHSKMVLHLLRFSFRVFEKVTRRDEGNLWCYVITSVYGAFGAAVVNSASTASNGRCIYEFHF